MAYPDAIVTPAGAPAGPPIPVPVNGPIAVQTQTDWPLRENRRRTRAARAAGGLPPDEREVFVEGFSTDNLLQLFGTQRADAYATARAVALAHHTKPH